MPKSTRIRKYTGEHEDIYDRRCPVCTHRTKDLIEAAYARWYTAKELSECFGIPVQAVREHARVLELDIERADDTKALYARMLEKGFETLDEHPITPRLMLQIAKHWDVLEHRVVHQVQQQKYGTVQIVGIPTPGGLIDAPEEKLAIEGTATPLLSPMTATLEAEDAQDPEGEGQSGD